MMELFNIFFNSVENFFTLEVYGFIAVFFGYVSYLGIFPQTLNHASALRKFPRLLYILLYQIAVIIVVFSSFCINRSDFMIYGVFGLPRSGKTTYLAKLAKRFVKRGVPVFSNFPCKGCYKLNFDDLGKFDFADSVILIDEISLVCDSRDWKKFNSDLVYFFTNHGHYNIDIYYCSQWFTDTDIKIRRMTEELYYIERKFLGLSMRYTVCRDITTTDSGDITDKYSFKHGRLFFRPRYYHMFDSYSRKPFPSAPRELW